MVMIKKFAKITKKITLKKKKLKKNFFLLIIQKLYLPLRRQKVLDS